MLVEDIGYEMRLLALRAGSFTMSYRSDRLPKAHKKWDIFIALGCLPYLHGKTVFQKNTLHFVFVSGHREIHLEMNRKLFLPAIFHNSERCYEGYWGEKASMVLLSGKLSAFV